MITAETDPVFKSLSSQFLTSHQSLTNYYTKSEIQTLSGKLTANDDWLSTTMSGNLTSTISSVSNELLLKINATQEFSQSSTYNIGDCVTVDGKMYVCQSNVLTAGEWSEVSTSFSEYPIGDILNMYKGMMLTSHQSLTNYYNKSEIQTLSGKLTANDRWLSTTMSGNLTATISSVSSTLNAGIQFLSNTITAIPETLTNFYSKGEVTSIVDSVSSVLTGGMDYISGTLLTAKVDSTAYSQDKTWLSSTLTTNVFNRLTSNDRWLSTTMSGNLTATISSISAILTARDNYVSNAVSQKVYPTTWLSDVAYSIDDMVEYNGQVYRCKEAVPGNQDWNTVSSKFEVFRIGDAISVLNHKMLTSFTETDPVFQSLSGDFLTSHQSLSDYYTKTEVDSISAYLSSRDAEVYFGTCSTAASANTKVISCPSFPGNAKGRIVFVQFTYAHTGTSTLQLNVNSAGAVDVKINGSTTDYNFNKSIWYGGQTIGFEFDGTNWVALLPNKGTTDKSGLVMVLTSYTSSNLSSTYGIGYATSPSYLNTLISNYERPPDFLTSQAYKEGTIKP